MENSTTEPRSAAGAVSIEGPTPLPLGISILVVSDTRTLATDESGALLEVAFGALGHRVERRGIVSDDLVKLRERVEIEVADARVQVLVVTGGTGITGRDVTPEAIEPLLTKTLPGFGELFRSLSYADIGAATIQSRAFAGLIDTTLVFALPGSTGAVRLAVERILGPQLDVRTRPCNFAELLSRLGER